MSRVPEPSVFLVVDEAKRKARERGVGLIDLSIGSTDLPPPEAPLKALAEALNDPTTYGYCLKSCTLPFLEEAARWYQGAGSMEEASSQLCTHLQSIAGAARQVLGEQGVGYSATAQMTEMYFPTRDYGDFRLPAGRYRTLRVTLGEGAGKNWWCVVFPSLCLPAATQEEALLTLPERERQVVEGGQNVQVKLKAVELWESLREWLRG